MDKGKQLIGASLVLSTDDRELGCRTEGRKRIPIAIGHSPSLGTATVEVDRVDIRGNKCCSACKQDRIGSRKLHDEREVI